MGFQLRDSQLKTNLHQVGLVPSIVFEGHLPVAVLGLLAFIAVQVLHIYSCYFIPSSAFETTKS